MASVTGQGPAMSTEKCLRTWASFRRCSPRHVVDLLMGRDLRPLHHGRDQLLGQQTVQGIAEIVVGVFLEVPQEPPVQGLIVQGGLQIELQPVGSFCQNAAYGRRPTGSPAR